jgi:hypothetical protein
MDIPDYVTVEEVRRVCRELKISDWTAMTDASVKTDEARAIMAEIGVEGMNINLEDFRRGLEVELEHGLTFKDANVTNNHPILTGKIVLAHFKESLDYYRRLDVAEIEGDLLKAAKAKDLTRLHGLYRKLVEARLALSKAESEQLA